MKNQTDNVYLLFNFLSYRDKDNDTGEVRVYPGKLKVSQAFCTIPVDSNTTVADLMKESLKRFDIDYKCEELRCIEVLLDRGGKKYYRIELEFNFICT